MTQAKNLDVYSEMYLWPVGSIMRGGCGLRSRFSILNYATLTGHLSFWLRLEAALGHTPHVRTIVGAAIIDDW